MKETTQAKATAKTAFGCLKGLALPCASAVCCMLQLYACPIHLSSPSTVAEIEAKVVSTHPACLPALCPVLDAHPALPVVVPPTATASTTVPAPESAGPCG